VRWENDMGAGEAVWWPGLDEEIWDLGIVGVVEMERVVGEAAFSVV
jgi:hypothetical protein